jgi:adenylate kinase
MVRSTQPWAAEPGGGVAARLIVLGRQGAGKGTQCSRLAERLGISHVSTGDLMRDEIARRSPIGRQIERFVAIGDLVPDEIVLDLVATKLGNASHRADGYLLDGFPRTLAQGQALFEVLGAGAAELAVEIDVPIEIVSARLAARRVCAMCGFITAVSRGDEARLCIRCDGVLTRRTDDQPEAITRRLAHYDEQAGPLLIWLDGLGLLVTVDGAGPPDEVHERIVAAVAGRLPAVRAIAF